jgi:LPS-assembly protein
MISLLHNVKHTHSILSICFLFAFSLQVNTCFAQKDAKEQSLTKFSQNSVLENNDSFNKIDTSKTSKKTIATKKTIDTLYSKDSLDAPIKYKAQDSGVLIIATKEFYLYGNSSVVQNTMSLDANTILYNGNKQTVLAYGAKDTSNNPLSKPTMKDASNTTISDTIAFNLKTLKGRTVNSYYTEGELFVNAKVLKKVSANVFYGYKGRFTTCNLDEPHFAFRTKKLKMITNKIAISGPTSAEIEGIPIPIGIPFGIYPLNRGRHSGLMAPQFVTSEDFGIGLEGLGYYKVLSDNIDVTVRTSLYSYGGWNLNISSTYLKRYKYSGNFNITFQNVKSLNRYVDSKGEFNESKSFRVDWRHTRDNRARPGTSFAANVNFGSTSFNKTVLSNPTINYNNQLASSINYTKDFRGKANISLNANHSQNSNSKLVTLTLPSLSVNVMTIYPFQPKEKIGKAKWYESIGIGYTGSFNNAFSFYDTAFNLKKVLDTMQWSATHNIPITLALPSLGPITIAPSISYSETWHDRSTYRRWNSAQKKLDTITAKGIIRNKQMSFGISANTRIFGTVNFKNSKSIKAIRHELRPSIGLAYTPYLGGNNNYYTQIDTQGTVAKLSKIDGNRIFSERGFGGISFGIDNLLELKVKNKKDTAASATKKVKLIDGFGFNGSYNLIGDSCKLSPISFYFRTNLFEKINITANASMDTYVPDSTGNRTKHLLWYAKKPSLGRITSANIAISTQLKSKPRDEKLTGKNATKINDPFMTPEEQQRQLEFARANPAEFTDFNIPWSVSLNYSLNFSNVPNSNYRGFTTNTTSSLNFNGDFSLTEKWKMGATGYYDVSNSKLSQFSFFVTREMHCWQLSINVTPVNVYKSFNITLNPKSGLLRDLKINRTRQFINQ